MIEEQRKIAHHAASLQVVVAIVDNGHSEKVLRVYRLGHGLLDYVWMCRGTAKTEMLDLLGLGDTLKETVICVTSTQCAKEILYHLGKELKMKYPGNGIAFAIPITSIGVKVHKMLTQFDSEVEDKMDGKERQGERFEVVAAILDQGYTNLIMDVARKEGARGGTVISARGIAENEVKKFLGIEIQAEKEIVFLVVKLEEKQRIMTEIMKAVGLKTESHGIVLSFPVSDAIGLAD